MCLDFVVELAKSLYATINTKGLVPSSPGGSEGKEYACSVRDLGLIPGGEDLLEKGMATHSRILVRETP